MKRWRVVIELIDRTIPESGIVPLDGAAVRELVETIGEHIPDTVAYKIRSIKSGEDD